MDNIYDALKSDKDVRITCGDKWLVWEEVCYVVYQKKYRSKKVIQLIQSSYLEDCLSILMYINN